MFKNTIIFRINAGWVPPELAAFEEALNLARFAPLGTSERETFGWVEPRGEKHGPLVEVIGGEYILKLMGESKIVPSSVVKDKLQERCEKIEKDTGRKPGSKQKKDLKQEIEHELLATAFSKKGATRMWISPKAGLVVVEAGSIKKAENIVTLFIKAMAEIGNTPELHELNTAMAPSAAMATWLTTKEAPVGFSVDRECELKSTDGDKATVRYARHTLDIQEVVDHITQGKTPTKLAMTYGDRVSFLLADDLSLKKVEILDIVMTESASEDNGFDTNVAIMTGELLKLIPALIEVLGGEHVFGETPATAVAGGAESVVTPSGAAANDGGAADSAEGAPWDQNNVAEAA